MLRILTIVRQVIVIVKLNNSPCPFPDEGPCTAKEVTGSLSRASSKPVSTYVGDFQKDWAQLYPCSIIADERYWLTVQAYKTN